MQYLSIKEKVETQIVEKKSKFIATLIPVKGQQELIQALEEVKRMYHDARHNCFAYRILNDEKVTERASDDGEPSGTAGAPMLELLRGNKLVNVLVVVTRYFGGILLGTGGLVKAYSDVTASAIKQAETIELVRISEFSISIEYSQLEKMKHYLNKIGGKITNIEYLQNIEANIYVPQQYEGNFNQEYTNIPFEMIKCTLIGKKNVDISMNQT